MMFDIIEAYDDPSKELELLSSAFPTNEFSFSCETGRLDIDERQTQ